MNDKADNSRSGHIPVKLPRGSDEGLVTFGTFQTLSSGLWRVEAIKGCILPILSVFHDIHSLIRWLPTGWTLEENQLDTWKVSISADIIEWCG